MNKKQKPKKQGNPGKFLHSAFIIAKGMNDECA